MRIHFLQHAACDGPGNMASILENRGHELRVTHIYRGDSLPDIKALDWLIILGGDMGVHDESQYPWLTREKIFINEVINSQMPVLGICLGAQLIAHLLGARVSKNRCPEIGWFPVTRSVQAGMTILKHALPRTFNTFHWHGDTFDTPGGAWELGSSPACRSQGFVIGNRIVGLQFHPEVRETDVRAFFEEVAPEQNGEYVQTEKEILGQPRRFDENARIMAAVLDAMERACR